MSDCASDCVVKPILINVTKEKNIWGIMLLPKSCYLGGAKADFFKNLTWGCNFNFWFVHRHCSLLVTQHLLYNKLVCTCVCKWYPHTHILLFKSAITCLSLISHTSFLFNHSNTVHVPFVVCCSRNRKCSWLYEVDIYSESLPTGWDLGESRMLQFFFTSDQHPSSRYLAFQQVKCLFYDSFYLIFCYLLN